MSASRFLMEADLHGLVDGQIEAGRRADALRRLAASPADRARVEGWQAQTDMLRSAFSGVDREPIPAILDLRARPQLHCIPANDAPLVAPAPDKAKPRSRRLAMAGAFALSVGLVGGWLMWTQTGRDEAPVSTTLLSSTPLSSAPVASTRGMAIDAELARRTAAAVFTPSSAARPMATDLPTTRIPDLQAAGFRFVSAETDPGRPPAVLFRYQNAKAERLVVSVARAADPVTALPTRVGRAVSWQTGDKVFALAGTPNYTRLQDIAVALQRTNP